MKNFPNLLQLQCYWSLAWGKRQQKNVRDDYTLNKSSFLRAYPANIYLFKVNDRNIRKGANIRKGQWRYSGVFIVNFEHISHFFLMFLLLTWNEWMLAGYVTSFRTWPINDHCDPCIKTSQLICSEKRLIGFYMRETLGGGMLTDFNILESIISSGSQVRLFLL